MRSLTDSVTGRTMRALVAAALVAVLSLPTAALADTTTSAAPSASAAPEATTDPTPSDGSAEPSATDPQSSEAPTSDPGASASDTPDAGEATPQASTGGAPTVDPQAYTGGWHASRNSNPPCPPYCTGPVHRIPVNLHDGSCAVAPTVEFPNVGQTAAWHLVFGDAVSGEQDRLISGGSIVSWDFGASFGLDYVSQGSPPSALYRWYFQHDPAPTDCVDSDALISVQIYPQRGYRTVTNTGTAPIVVGYGLIEYAGIRPRTVDGTVTVAPGQTVNVQSSREELNFFITNEAGTAEFATQAVPVWPGPPPTSSPAPTPGTTTEPAAGNSQGGAGSNGAGASGGAGSNGAGSSVNANGSANANGGANNANARLPYTGVAVEQSAVLAGGLLAIGVLLLMAGGRRRPHRAE